jgi:hypothetical protein
MNIQDQDIDKIFRDGLKDFEALPSDDVWQNIYDELHKKKKNFVIIFLRAAAIFIIVAITGGILYLVAPTRNNLTNSNQLSVTSQHQAKIKSNLHESDINPTDKSKENKTIAQNSFNSKQINELSDNFATEDVNQDAITKEVLNDEEVVENKNNKPQNDIPTSNENGSLAYQVSGKRNELKTYIDQPQSNSNLLHVENKNSENSNPFDLKTIEPLKSERISYFNEPLNYSLMKKDSTPEEIFDHFINQKAKLMAEENDGEKKKGPNKWLLGGQISPTYSYRQDNSSDQTSGQEKGLMTYSGGVNVNYKAAERLIVQSGFYYSKMGQTISSSSSVNSLVISNYSTQSSTTTSTIITSTGSIVVTSTNYISTSSPRSSSFASDASDNSSTTEFIQNFNYVELPLLLRYKIIGNKNGLNLIGGLSTRMLVGDETYMIISGEKKDYDLTSDLAKFNYTAIVGLGFDRPITKHLIFSLEPSFRYHLNSISTDSDINTHLYSFGVFTGILYSF